jgi:acetolactate synthase I/II/III large subunit
MEHYAGAEDFIRVLNQRGVENIFFNPGIDTVPVQVTLSRLKAAGKKAPALILCLDESVAMAAAHGHYMVSGKPQVVMAHRELGTFQVGGQWTNVQCGRVPLIFCAGLPGGQERTTWQGKPYDQGSIVRNNVKWDFEVGRDESLADAAGKALEVATCEPSGPVYMAPAGEAMLQKNSKSIAAAVPTSAPAPDLGRDVFAKAAKILLGAENPLILAGQSGRNAESISALVKLAEVLAARVISSPVRVNFPTEHPLCAGIDPIGGGSRSLAHYLTEADAVLLIDYDLPYAPMPISPSSEAKLIYLTLDSGRKSGPLWGIRPALFMEADSFKAIPQLCQAIERNLTPAKVAELSARATRIGQEHQKIRDEQRGTAKGRSAQKPICPDWLCQCIGQIADEDTVIVNQTITHSGFVGEQIFRSRPHSLLACAGGSIGWALGAALGAKIAARDKIVISLMGDGAFIWGCPESTLWTAKSYHAPFLAVIFNNRAYAAIKGLVQRAYGEEKISAQTGFDSGVDIASPPDYAKIAEACGAYGSTVKEPEDVLPGLQRALAEVKRGRAAVVDVWL